MNQFYYNIFDDGDHILRLKVNRDMLIDDCKCDYTRRSLNFEICAESFEASGLIKFLPEALREKATSSIASFDFSQCFTMERKPDYIGRSDDYI